MCGSTERGEKYLNKSIEIQRGRMSRKIDEIIVYRSVILKLINCRTERKAQT